MLPDTKNNTPTKPTAPKKPRNRKRTARFRAATMLNLPERPLRAATKFDARIWGTITRNLGSSGAYFSSRDMLTRPYCCPGCSRNCRHNFDDGFAKEPVRAWYS